MRRDDFSRAVKTKLAERVNYLCSNPECRASTSGPQVNSNASINLGVAAHISAAAPKGPRYNFNFSSSQREAMSNGIWLCQNCAKLIDSDALRFTRSLLEEWKRNAELEALGRIGKPSIQQRRYITRPNVYDKLRREANPRFGFSFKHPSFWDRQDPTNGDGNTFRHPNDARVEMRVWGGYAVVLPDLSSWVTWTIEIDKQLTDFELISDVPSGSYVIDWRNERDDKLIETRQQVEGHRVVYFYTEAGTSYTSMQMFLQLDDTQVGLRCQAPTSLYNQYEELFIVLTKEVRFLGPNTASFARG